MAIYFILCGPSSWSSAQLVKPIPTMVLFEEMQPAVAVAGYSDTPGSLALTMVMTLTPIPNFEQR